MRIHNGIGVLDCSDYRYAIEGIARCMGKSVLSRISTSLRHYLKSNENERVRLFLEEVERYLAVNE